MAKSELEELFDEGAEKCLTLMQLMVAATDAVDEIESNAKTVGDKLESEVEEAQGTLKNVTALVTKTEKEMKDAVAGAVKDLDDVVAKAGDAGGELEDLVEKVAEASDSVKEAEATVRADVLKDGNENLDAALKEYGEKVAATTKALEEDQKKSLDALTAFGKELDEARGELGTQQEAWATALDELTDEAGEQARANAKSLGDGADAQANAMLALINATIDDHNTAMAALDKRFTDDAKQSLETAMAPLVTALQEVQRLAEERRQQISEKGNEILNSLVLLIPQIEAAAAELESAADVNG